MDTQRLQALAGISDSTQGKETIVEQPKELLIEMKKPQAGQAFGANDQDAPEQYTVDQLSRCADMLYCANKVGGRELAQQVFKCLPQELKGEFNFSKWKYQPESNKE